VSGWRNLENNLDFSGFNLDTTQGDDETKEFSKEDGEDTFLWLKVNIVLNE
ncbi:hypothetical protein KI387_033075, partial [Taxus chinensis]